MTAYYNENEPFAAEWLRRLITAGLIAPGVVDERSIEDIAPDELTEYTQCHFFAGIGGWSYALRLAGWPDDRPVWTGSCPCQPFSAAGARRGADDERHLWPAWRWLVDQCRPAVIFGEQVASKDGRGWLAGVRADLERMGYAVGAADLCAAGVGAPHIRQRLYWLADRERVGRDRRPEAERLATDETGERSQSARDVEPRGAPRGMGNPNSSGREAPLSVSERVAARSEQLAHASAWRAVFVSCADGKARRIEPGIKPLAHGVPGRVGLLRAYGNAIVPQVAQQFIEAYLEI